MLISESDICRIYEASPMAAAVVGSDGSLKWSNAAFDKLCGDYSDNIELYFCEPGTEKEINRSSDILRIAASSLNEDVLLNVSQISVESFFRHDSIANYLEDVFALGRHISSLVSFSTDSIFSTVLDSDKLAADESVRVINDINNIDTSMRTLLSGYLLAEKLVSRDDRRRPTDISACLQKMLDTVSYGFEGDDTFVTVTSNIEKDLYAYCEFEMLELLLSSFLVSAIRHPCDELTIDVNLSRAADGAAMILAVSCQFVSGRRNMTLFESAALPQRTALRPDIFAMLSDKFSNESEASVAVDFNGNPMTFTVTLPACEEDDNDFNQLRTEYSARQRYSPVRVMLSEFGTYPEYSAENLSAKIE